jgi:arabinogalactan endo-1,4-beta-galactosidase
MRKVIPIFFVLIFVFIFQQPRAAVFAYGADVSWLPQMEAQGIKFYDDAGVQKDCLLILKEHGVTAIRLRIWVNPSANSCTGHCSKAETVTMAKRVAAMGFRVMIDFHYSDSWADPGQQTKPATWNTHAIAQLRTDVYDHTFSVLDTIIKSGVHLEWVQVGNETNDGMLWEDGRASKSFTNFASLITSGYNAVKAADSSIKVIVHISNGYNNSLFRWMFDSLTAKGAKYDVIGMSLYPTAANWTTLNSQCLTNMNDVSARYGKEVMIAEVGMAADGTTSRNQLTDLITKVKSVPNGKGIGIFYWEPQSYNWCGYSLGAWNTNGRPTVAMDAFLASTKINLKNSVRNSSGPGCVELSFHSRQSVLQIRFNLPYTNRISLKIFDMMGRGVMPVVIQKADAGSNITSCAVSGLGKGVYTVQLQDEKTRKCVFDGKFVKI